MSIFLLFIIFIINTLALWLSAKFLGKSGMWAFVAVMAGLSASSAWAQLWIFGVYVPQPLAFVIPMFFALYLIFKNYGVGETIKGGISILAIFLIVSLVAFFEYLFEGVNFFITLRLTLVPMIISMIAFIISVLGFVVLSKTSTIFMTVESDFRDLILGVISLLSAILIYVLFAEWNLELAFGQICLSFVVTSVFAVLFLGILYVLSKYVFIVNEESGIEHKIQNKSQEILEKKSSSKSKVKTAYDEEDDDD